MKKVLSILMLLLMVGVYQVQAQMSDVQVVEYIKDAVATGKGEKQIGKELLLRGVTPEQMQRIKAQYQSTQGSETMDTPATEETSSGQTRRAAANSSDDGRGALDAVSVTMAEDPTENIKLERTRQIFGHDIFKGRSLSFEPNTNVPTPENYVLGPGDEVVIDIWGEHEASIRQTISPEGRIMVSQIGPIYLNGLTIKAANALLRKQFAQKYAGIMGEEPNSEINLTLGQIRTIMVNIFGEVGVSGTYRLTSFATVFHALYRAGGVNTMGTIRNIQIIRGGKQIAEIDLYPFLYTGKMDSDFRLQDGDVIRVPTYERLVSIEGEVKKPMFYEIKEGETVADLIQYAGGFEPDAYCDEVRMVRQIGKEREIHAISQAQYGATRLESGDVITVISTSIDRYANRVEVRGMVFRPGMYELGSAKTVKGLIQQADGLMEDAFTDRVRLLRQKEDFTPEILSLNLTGIMAGTVADVELRKNDVLEIPSVHELKDLGTLTIMGSVARPGTYTFAENTSIEDLIIQAGGLLDGASAVRVEVSRRIKNPTSEMPTDTLAEVIITSFDPSLKLDKGNSVILKPYDIVRIRKSPGYREQVSVSIVGEVAFPGEYTLLTNNERLSDIVKRAGGATRHSYLHGAQLIRQKTPEERTLQSATKHMLKQHTTDSMNIDMQLDLNQYAVGIELDKALENPGSEYDLLVREGDKILIPEYIATIAIDGEVMYPNSVSYATGKRVRYYINQAGGYTKRARRTRAYIVYMNGHVSRAHMLAKLEPGCEIVVPTRPEKQRTSATAGVAIATSIVSMSSVIATMITTLTRK